MSSAYPPSIPRSTIPVPRRQLKSTGIVGSVTSGTSRPPPHGQPEPGQIDAGLKDMLSGLIELEGLLDGVFDGVEKAFDPTINPNETRPIKTLRSLIETSLTTSLGGVPMLDPPASRSGPGSGAGSGSEAGAIAGAGMMTKTPLTKGTIGTDERNDLDMLVDTNTNTTALHTNPNPHPHPHPTTMSMSTPPTPTPTLAALATQIERASGSSYSRAKVLRDEARGVGEVLARR